MVATCPIDARTQPEAPRRVPRISPPSPLGARKIRRTVGWIHSTRAGRAPMVATCPIDARTQPETPRRVPESARRCPHRARREAARFVGLLARTASSALAQRLWLPHDLHAPEHREARRAPKSCLQFRAAPALRRFPRTLLIFYRRPIRPAYTYFINPPCPCPFFGPHRRAIGTIFGLPLL